MHQVAVASARVMWPQRDGAGGHAHCRQLSGASLIPQP
ncbi:hypothetical protein BIWAKO_01599 [Bosea sp. BIWAKO-01]|nr:hypothetical protein BIWAKO_01599 [Bosea sp. BIWAKO-01]